MVSQNSSGPINQKASGFINLLPPEIILIRKQSTRIALINRASVGLLLFLIFITTTTLVLRVLQNRSLQQVNTQIAYAQEKIGDLKDREGYAIALKSRIETIVSLGKNSTQTAIFNLVTSLTPAEVEVDSITVERNGVMVFSAHSPALSAVQNFLTSLSSKDKNSDLINSVHLETLTKGQDNIYRVSFRITPKENTSK